MELKAKTFKPEMFDKRLGFDKGKQVGVGKVRAGRNSAVHSRERERDSGCIENDPSLKLMCTGCHICGRRGHIAR